MGGAASFPSRLSARSKESLGFGGPVTTVYRLNLLSEGPSERNNVLAVAVDIIASSYAWYVEYINSIGTIMHNMGLWEEVARERVRRCAIFRFQRPEG